MKWALAAEAESSWARELAAVFGDLLEHDVSCLGGAEDLRDTDCVVLGGEGPAVGSRLAEAIVEWAGDGGLLLAIDAGFRTACELGLLPGQLLPNEPEGFLCKMVAVRVESVSNPWAQRAMVGDVWQMPLRTSHGRFAATEAEIEQLERDGLVLLRYVAPVTETAGELEAAHGGGGIAAVMGSRRNVLGIALHPENVVDASLVEPQWPGLESGRVLFESVVDWVEDGSRRGLIESER